MAQSLHRRANSLLLMDPFAMWEHPDSLLRRTGVTNTQSGDLSAERRVPAVEAAESGGNLIVSAELPGLSAEDKTIGTADYLSRAPTGARTRNLRARAKAQAAILLS